MTIGAFAFFAFLLSMAAVALAVVGRLALCGWRVARDGRPGAAVACAGAIALMVALVAWFAFVGFAYGIAHTAKSVWTDAGAATLAGLPLVAVGYALWRLAGRLGGRPDEPNG